MEEAVLIEETQVPGSHAPAAVDLDRPVLGQIAVIVVVEAAHLDGPHFSRWQRRSLAAYDAQLKIRQRSTDAAQTPLLARVRGDPADLAAAVALADTDPEALLEALPLLEQQRRRTGGDESQARNVGRLRPLVLVEQHVYVVGLPVAIVARYSLMCSK